MENDNLSESKESEIKSDLNNITEASADLAAPSEEIINKAIARNSNKNIYICYSADASFMERKLVIEVVKQLKENGLSADIWFDKDEKILNQCCWFSTCLETVENCKAVLFVLSKSFFVCPIAVYAVKTIIERLYAGINKIGIFTVLNEDINVKTLPKSFLPLLDNVIDISKDNLSSKSPYEKASIITGRFTSELEFFGSVFLPLEIQPTLKNSLINEYKTKTIHEWNVNDLQEWLEELGIREYYRQMFAEWFIDGHLVTTLTEKDLSDYLNIDNRVLRKKIMTKTLKVLDKEQKESFNWHLRCRTAKEKPLNVYFILDPGELYVSNELKTLLCEKSFNVLHHEKLGNSKDEFLKCNGPIMASCSHVLFFMTENIYKSQHVYQEVMFAEWIGKKIIVLLYKNVWFKLKSSLRALLGDCMAVDLQNNSIKSVIEMLNHVIKPPAVTPPVVLEQRYVNKTLAGLQPLSYLIHNLIPIGLTLETNKQNLSRSKESEKQPKVFISFQWDSAKQTDELRHNLKKRGINCWFDEIHAKQSSNYISKFPKQAEIQQNVEASHVMLCCITQKYLQSNNCVKDISIAQMLHKEIIPVLFSFVPWPPQSAHIQVCKLLEPLQLIDLSNPNTQQQNTELLVDRIWNVFHSNK